MKLLLKIVLLSSQVFAGLPGCDMKGTAGKWADSTIYSSNALIKIDNLWIYDLNGRNGKGLRGMFDGNKLTKYNISGMSEAVGDKPWRSFIVLPYVCKNMKIEHYDNYDAGTIEIRAYSKYKSRISSHTLVKEGAGVWNTLDISAADSIRFLEFLYTDTEVGVYEMKIYGDSIAPAPSIYRSETIIPHADPGSYAFGVNDLDNRLEQFDTTTAHNIILLKMFRSFRTGMEGQRFEFFPDGWSKPLSDTTAPLWMGRFGDDHIKTRIINFANTYGLKAQLYHTGGTIRNRLDSLSLVGSNNSYLADPLNNTKFTDPGSDSLNPRTWEGLAHMWRGIIHLYGTNKASSAAGLNIRINNAGNGGNKLPGQGGIDVFEVGNEWTRDFAGVRAWHSPQVNYTALRQTWIRGHQSDPNAKIFMGASTFEDTTYWKAMFFHHYWLYDTTVFPCDGINYNLYQNEFLDGQGGGPASKAVSPEKWRFFNRLIHLKELFDVIFPNKEVQISECGVSTADDSPFDADNIGAKPEAEVAADWELRQYAIAQTVPLLRRMFHYAAFQDGSANFSTMTTVVDYFGQPTGALVTKMGFALANQLYCEKDYKFYATILANGDTNGTWVTRKNHETNTNKKLFKIWRGSSNGSNSSVVVPVGEKAVSAILKTLRYDSYTPISKPVSITGNNVRVTATESIQWLEVTYTSTTMNK